MKRELLVWHERKLPWTWGISRCVLCVFTYDFQARVTKFSRPGESGECHPPNSERIRATSCLLHHVPYQWRFTFFFPSTQLAAPFMKHPLGAQKGPESSPSHPPSSLTWTHPLGRPRSTVPCQAPLWTPACGDEQHLCLGEAAWANERHTAASPRGGAGSCVENVSGPLMMSRQRMLDL